MYAKRREYAEFFSALAHNEPAILSAWQEKVHAFRDAEIAGLLGDQEFAALVAKILDLAAAYNGVDDKAALHAQEIRPFLLQLNPSSGPTAFCEAADALLTKKMGNVGSKKNWRGNDLEEFKAARKRLISILEQKDWLCRLTVEPSDPLVTGSLRLLRDLSFVLPGTGESWMRQSPVPGDLTFRISFCTHDGSLRRTVCLSRPTLQRDSGTSSWMSSRIPTPPSSRLSLPLSGTRAGHKFAFHCR